MSPQRDPSAAPRPPATPRERLEAARHVLLLAVAALAAGSVFWSVPVAFSAAAIGLLVLVAAYVPRRTVAERWAEESARSGIWPDTAMKVTVEAFPKPASSSMPPAPCASPTRAPGTLFPATRPGDPFTLTFRSPEIGDALGRGAPGRPRSVEFREPGETTNAYSVTLHPLQPPGEAGGFILVTFDDVSDRLAIARMRADFVANASHELRTPLASLTGFIETLLGPARNDPAGDRRNSCSIMLDQARRMRRLIDDLLSLSRVEMRVAQPPDRPRRSRRRAAPRRRRDAAARRRALRRAVGSMRRASRSRWSATATSWCRCSRTSSRTPSATARRAASVDVRLEPRRRTARRRRSTCRTTARALPPEHLPRLTERFYRVDVGASREMKGTGLGLAIVKHILTRHRGRLEVQSRPGEGARFTVDLPSPQPICQAQADKAKQ